MKSVLILALGATLAAAGSANAGEAGSSGSVSFNAAASQVAALGQSSVRGFRTQVRAENQGYGGRVIDRNCDCNVPSVSVPFYTVRPPAPPIRVRAPGIRVTSVPVYAPSPAIYIQGPPIYVDAPPVNVAPAQVYLEAPDVHVRPSEVTVAPPEIHFTPAGDHPADNCCLTASPPAVPLNLPPPGSAGPVGPTPGYLPPAPGYTTPAPAPADGYLAPASSSGYAQEPGERG